MANTYVIKLSNVYAKDFTGTQKIYQVDVDITSGGSPVTGLSDKFTLLKNGSAFTDFTAEAASGNIWKVIISTGSELLTTDYLSIQAINGADKSDELLVDFAQTFSTHQATYNYTLPAEAGSYSVKLDKVNGSDFSTAAASENFTLTDKAPLAANSKVSIEKPYLIKFSGSVLNVTVTLNNATDDAADGAYEVSFYGDLS